MLDLIKSHAAVMQRKSNVGLAVPLKTSFILGNIPGSTTTTGYVQTLAMLL